MADEELETLELQYLREKALRSTQVTSSYCHTTRDILSNAVYLMPTILKC